MIVVGTASAAATSLTIPAHQPGDMIVIFVRRAFSTQPTVPAIAGNVPNWNQTIATGSHTNLGTFLGWHIALTSTVQTGVWTNASHICVLVLRADAGKQLISGTAAWGGATATQTVVYPAQTLQRLDGNSWVIRTGAREVADDEIAVPPSGYTNWIAEPAGAGCVMAVHTRAGVTGNPTLDTVNTTGTAATYRTGALEIQEQPLVAGPSAIALYDNFNRANGAVNAGAGSSLWLGVNALNQATLAVILSNRLAFNTADTFTNAITTASFAADCDFVIEYADPSWGWTLSFFWAFANPGSTRSGYFFQMYQTAVAGKPSEDWFVSSVTNGAATTLFSLPNVGLTTLGSLIWIQMRGSTISVYRQIPGDNWRRIISFTNTLYNRSGQFAVQWGAYGSVPNALLDNLYVPGPSTPKVVAVV